MPKGVRVRVPSPVPNIRNIVRNLASSLIPNSLHVQHTCNKEVRLEAMRTAVLMTVRAPRERSEIRERRGSAAHTGRLSPPHPPVLPPELEPAESEGCFAVAGATALEPAVTGEPTAARLGLLCLISHPATRIGAYLGQSEGRLILWRGSEGNLCGRRGPDPTLSTGARSRGSAPGGLCGQVGRSS